MPKSKPVSPKESVCSLPSDVGLCRASIERWFFDAATGDCATFVWGGCGGNENNFVSKEKCMDRCSEVNDDDDDDVNAETKEGTWKDLSQRCTLDKDEGPCRAAFQR